jgi:hypothetical protein
MQNIVILLFLLLTPTSQAHAYLDAGTGSMVVQALLGGIAGIAVLIKMYWRHLLGFLTKNRSKE